MPLFQTFQGPSPSRWVFAALSSDGQSAADVATPGATIATTQYFVRAAAGLYGYDTAGAVFRRVLVDATGLLLTAAAAEARSAGSLHRNAIASADVLSAPAIVVLTDRSADGGALTFNTQYWANVAAVSLQTGSAAIIGVTTVPATQTVTTANDANNAHRVRIAITQVTNADAYLIFFSANAAPLLAGYVTEAQRAAGGQLNAFATYVAGGVANAIDIGFVGTGLATTNAVFAQNTAHRPNSVTLLSCVAYSRCYVHVRCALSKTAVWTAAPSFTLLPWLVDQEGSPDRFAGAPLTATLMGAAGSSQEIVFEVDVDGAVGIVVTIAAMAGLASISVWLELAS